MAPRSKLLVVHPIHGYTIKPQQDLKTIKRNERERNRVETVNRGFETLRMHVPTAAQVKKMSKVNILTQAVDYIMYLQQVLEETSQMTPVQTMTTSPVSPVWSHHQQQAQYHHHQYQSPVTPVAPVYHHDSSSSHGYYSDTSLQSPASRSWTQSPEFNKLSWSASLTDQRYFQNIKQESPEVPDSTTTDMNDSSGDEDDVLDAIAEWQQI